MTRWEALADIVRSFNAKNAVGLAFAVVVVAFGLPVGGLIAVTYLTLG